MKTSSIALAAAVSLLAFNADAKRPAPSTPAPAWSFACSAVHLDLPDAVDYTGCSGFFEGNLLGGSPDQQNAIAAAIAPLGIVNTTAWLEKLDGNGSTTIDFSRMLYGDTVIGIHFGAGAWSDPKPSGGATAFYHFDAGTAGLDAFGIELSSSSGVALFRTGDAPVVPSPVPEPGTYALLLAGLAMVGFVTRRRNRV